MKRVWCVVLIMCAVAGRLYAGIGEWKTYTSKREIRDLAEYQGTLWAATNGGLFSFRQSDNSFSEFTTSEGLRSIDVTTVTVDDNGIVWIGASNGIIHRYNPFAREWNYIMDIALRNDPAKRINALKSTGDTLIILSDAGISLFSISKMEFGDTYARFGVSPGQISGNATSIARFDGKLWVGTRQGLASTLLTNPNPSAPESWQVYTTTDGLPSNVVNGIVVWNDTLFAATSSGLSFFTGISWTTVVPTNGMNILDLIADDALYYITSAEFRIYGGTESGNVESGFPSNLTSLVSASVIGSLLNGLLIKSGNVWNAVLPSGPPSNKFVGIAVDEGGVVWSGTGTANGDGIMSFDGQQWKTYSVASDTRLGTNNYYSVSIGRNNTKWVSNWGAGVALIDGDGNVQKVLNTTNGLSSTIDSLPFVVVGGVATDLDGITWITNRTARPDTALVLFHPDSSLSYIVGFETRSPSNIFSDVIIDYNDTKWFANFSRFESETPLGFFYYNENIALPGTSNGWGRLTKSDGLTSEKIWSVAVDHDGALWIGSDQGISIIFDTRNPRQRIAAYHPLRDQIIQAIAVDALNNKWIATKQGVFLLSADGTVIYDRMTVESTSGKLLDDDVTSIAINHKTGVIYFGTEKGLSSLSTNAVVPNSSFTSLSFAPNPFYIPSPVSLTVDGLVQGTVLKILSIDGTLIKEIQTPGGRIGFWDGQDEKGQYVSSGIYLVVAYSEDGSKVSTGKVAVIRR